MHDLSVLAVGVSVVAVGAMTPAEFIAKWRASELKESSAEQEHFIDLCRLLGEPTPAETDPTGERYCFERGARKDTGGDGWADVWKRGCFAWEYKGRHANLDAAFHQLRQYALALDNLPLIGVRVTLPISVRSLGPEGPKSDAASSRNGFLLGIVRQHVRIIQYNTVKHEHFGRIKTYAVTGDSSITLFAYRKALPKFVTNA